MGILRRHEYDKVCFVTLETVAVDKDLRTRFVVRSVDAAGIVTVIVIVGGQAGHVVNVGCSDAISDINRG